MRNEIGGPQVAESRILFGNLSNISNRCHKNVVVLSDSRARDSFIHYNQLVARICVRHLAHELKHVMKVSCAGSWERESGLEERVGYRVLLTERNCEHHRRTNIAKEPVVRKSFGEGDGGVGQAS